ncbi:uncharacterized protein LOC122065447 [Macadamia integrifolia]|uniref:uncharacterized protein LOC122065447 n=1 Tax=Macadamia integrifolia TaxID=60698 RepID=UPI001C4E6FC6|nr:uncharacterized protein LOC122065447 [Macadamia integrifolia]
MAERLSNLLPHLVSDEQCVVQKGKIISANIGLASELANLLHTSVRGSGMGIKVDVQKVYDTMSWDFLFAVLKKFGFSDVWLGWIYEILVSSRILVLFNGGPIGFIDVERELRQGDPISPILFILAEEVLCRGLNGLLNEGKIKALPGPRGAKVPTHLLFADDIFIFLNATAKHVKCLREFLHKYQLFSGKKFNLEKSKIFFGKVALHRKRFIADLIGIPSCALPTKYLEVEILRRCQKG